MSKKVEDILEKLEESAKQDPVIDACAKLATHAVDSERKNADAFAKSEERDDELAVKIEKTAETIDTKMEKGFALVQDKLERVYTRNSAINAITASGTFVDTTDELLAAMPEAQRKSVGRYEAVASNYAKDSKLSDPVLCAATDRWFKLSSKLQLAKFAAHHGNLANDHSKLTEAFRVVSKASLQVGATDEGGNLVPTIVENEILRLILDAGDIFPRCRRINMTANTHALPSESTGVTINWVAEEGALTEGNPVFGQVNLVANKIAGRSTFSIELMEDSNVAIVPYLQSIFAEGIAGELDAQAAEGSGSPFTGINAGATTNTLAATTATAGDSPTFSLLVQAFVKAGEKSTRNSGIWIMHPGVFGNVWGMVDSNGQPILKYGDAAGTPTMSIFGRPVIVSNRLATTTVGSDATGQIYFGPPEKLLAGYRSGMRWDVSDAPNWGTYQMDARLVGRFGFAVGVEKAWTVVSKVHAD